MLEGRLADVKEAREGTATRGRKLTLGRYPVFDLGEARDFARSTLQAVAMGLDPAREKRERRAAPPDEDRERLSTSDPAAVQQLFTFDHKTIRVCAVSGRKVQVTVPWRIRSEPLHQEVDEGPHLGRWPPITGVDGEHAR